jgi:DNA (cytosine-5)-methyltransferase 1
MKYLSVCSGIEAATVAWHDLGWKPAGFSEIESFPSAVLQHHYPEVTNFGDMTKFKEWNLEPNDVDLLVGGTPCQSFSVAGLRKGLDDPRGNLALVYCSMLDHFRPKWFVWENVPGVLSSSGGRDFGSFLGAVAELGYGFSYRVLDAQYFGVAQRRRRVFVVGHLGDWRPAAAVLFEQQSLCRDTAPRREAGQEAAKCLTRGACQRLDYETEDFVTYGIPGNWIGRKPENGGNAVEPMHDVSPCLTKTDRHGVAQPIAMRESGQGYWMEDDKAGTLRAEGENRPSRPSHVIAHHHAVAQPVVAPTLTASNDPSRSPQSTEVTNQVAAIYATTMAVRRLTPVECERLQGFPDNYTNIPWRNKPESPDGPRYKAIGNSMAVPVMKWIGERIKMVDELC